MKAIVVRDYGPVDGIDYADWPEPVAKGRQIVIQSEAIGVNFPDGLLVQGLYQMKPPTPRKHNSVSVFYFPFFHLLEN